MISPEPRGGTNKPASGPDRVNSMKRFTSILMMALLGAAAGSAIRQKVKPLGESGELVIAASPTAIAVGLFAGLLAPRAKRFVALVVGINVGANEAVIKQKMGWG